MVDNTIALRLQSPQVESPLNRMARGMQMLAFKAQADTAQQTTAKNAMLNQAFQASIDPKTGAIDYGKAAATLASLGGGAYAPDVMNAGSAATTARIAADKAVFDQKRANLEAVGRDIMAFGNANDAKAYVAKAVQDGHLEPQMAQAIVAQIPQDPTQFPVWQQRTTRALTLTGPQQLEQDVHNRDMGNKGDIFATPKYMGGAPGGIVPGSEYAIAPKPGSGDDGKETFFGNVQFAEDKDGNMLMGQPSNKGGPIQWQPVPPELRVLMPTRSIDLGTSYQTVSTLGGGAVQETPKDVYGEAYQKKLADLEAVQVAAAGSNLVFGETALKQIDGVLADPNLSKGTGVLSMVNFIPGSGSKAFQAKVDQVTSAAFLQGIQRMQGTGAITEVEGAKATAALNRATTGLSEPEFRKAMKEYRAIVAAGVEKARELEGRRSGVGAEQPTAGAPPRAINPEDPLGMLGGE